MISVLILASSLVINTPGEDTVTYIEVQPGIYAGSDGSYLKELPADIGYYPYKPKPEESHPSDAGNPYQQDYYAPYRNNE